MPEPVAVLSTPDVARMLGVSSRTIYRLVKAGTFPKPFRLSSRRTGILRRDVEAWIAERKREREARA